MLRINASRVITTVHHDVTGLNLAFEQFAHKPMNADQFAVNSRYTIAAVTTAVLCSVPDEATGLFGVVG